jgi:hypothetical protein
MYRFEFEPFAPVNCEQPYCIDAACGCRHLLQSSILCEEHQAPDSIEQTLRREPSLRWLLSTKV